ncbi:MAG TPA: hypothetical protein VLV83_23205 [Acidobacteriota bacterium]|nr:hypothetical protein [Acidobacteriota bacterium]
MWILGGCAVIALIGVVFFAALGIMGYQFVRDMEELTTNPEMRRERVLEMLGAEQVPEGYYAGFVVGIPIVGDIVGLTDSPPQEDGEPGEPRERAFFYFSLRFMGDDKQQMEDFFTGKTDELEALENVQIQGPIDIEFRRAEFIKLGQFEVNQYTAYYRVMRGGVELSRSRGDSLAATMWIRCPDDSRGRFAAWVVPDPAALAAAGQPSSEADTSAASSSGPAGESSADAPQVDYQGTPNDEESLAAFMSQFNLCGTG